MSETAVKSIVLDFLQTGYQPQTGTAGEQANYLAALSEFSEQTLRLVVDRVRCEWPNRTWPVPGLLRRWAVEASPPKARPRPERLPAPLARDTPERKRTGEQLTRWKNLMRSGEFWKLTHEQAYDAVYRGEMGPAHKAGMMGRLTGKPWA